MATSDLYNQYEDWKKWDQNSFYKVDKTEMSYLDKELGIYDLRGKNVLELGFGNATKLAWVASRGATVFGTELNEDLCARARSVGITVLSTDFDALKHEYKDRFDLIIAYDVFEHLTIDQVREALVAVSEMLHTNGSLVARFPNGRSPLGRTLQYADHTHRSVLSDVILVHLSKDLNMSVEKKSNGDYIYFPKSLRGAISSLKIIVRSLMNRVIQKLYDIDTPIGSNIIIHLRKL